MSASVGMLPYHYLTETRLSSCVKALASTNWIILDWRLICCKLARNELAEILRILFREASIVCKLNPSWKETCQHYNDTSHYGKLLPVEFIFCASKKRWMKGCPKILNFLIHFNFFTTVTDNQLSDLTLFWKPFLFCCF